MIASDTSGTTQILQLLSTHHTLRPAEIHRVTNFSRQHIHAILKSLLLSGQIIRRGTSPRTYYSLAKAGQQSSETILQLTDKQHDILQSDFLIIKKEGHQVSGVKAICDYAQELNQDPQQIAIQFLEARDKQLSEIEIDEGEAHDQIKLLETKEAVKQGTIQHFHFADYCEVGDYGDTALAKKLRTAKNSGNALLQLQLFRETERQLQEYIADYGVDAVAFIPGSTMQGKDLMKRWKETLDLPLPHVNLVRAIEENAVPQNIISLQTDREQAADGTLAVADHRRFRHVLLIDDELITGTTMQNAAQNIQEAGIAERVSAFAMIFDTV